MNTIIIKDHRLVIKNLGISDLSYNQRFDFYCKQFPFLSNLEGIRDCELVLIYDLLQEGHELKQILDHMVQDWEEAEKGWLEEEGNSTEFLFFKSFVQQMA